MSLPKFVMNDETPKPQLPLKSFNPRLMLENINRLRTIIQRIRQQEGGIGSVDDELACHRAVHDIDLLVDMVDGLKASYDELHGQLSVAAGSAITLQQQNAALKERYEEMIQARNNRIKKLEEAVGTPDEKPQQEAE